MKKLMGLGILLTLLISISSLAEEPKCEDYTDIDKIWISINENHTISTVATATKTFVKSYQVEHTSWKLCKKPEDCSYVFYFNRDNQQFKINKCRVKHDDKYIECPRERMREYADAWVVPFPSCEKDDILEYEVEWETTFPMENAFWSIQDIFFNGTNPILEENLNVKVPKTFDFKHYTTQLSPEVSEDETHKIYNWQVRNVNSYKPEDLMPSERIVLSRVSYSSIGSWNELEDWFESLFSEVINEEAVRNKTNEIIKDKKTKEEKTKAIYDWVRENIRYEESEFGLLTGYKPHKVDEILEYKFGDCKDQTVLLVSILNAADIEAYPALLSYKSIIDAPSPQAFYHSVVFVPRDVGDLWLDTTCNECPYGYTNSMIQGGMALVLFDTKSGFVMVPELPVDKNRFMETTGIINLKDDGSAEIYENTKWIGSGAIDMRSGFKMLKETDIEENLQKAVKEECTKGKLKNYTYSDLEKEDTRFIMTMNYTCEGSASRSGDKLIYDLRSKSIYPDVTSKEKRIFPIYLWPEEIVSSHKEIILPKCFSIDAIPDSFSRNESFADYNLKFDISENKLLIDTTARINSILVPPENFSTFKIFFEEIDSHGKQAIVFIPIRERVNGALKKASGSFTLTESKLNEVVGKGIDVSSTQDVLNNAKKDLEKAQNLFNEEKCIGAENLAADAEKKSSELMKSLELSIKLKELNEAVNEAEKEGANVATIKTELNKLIGLISDIDKAIENTDYNKSNEMIKNITVKSDEIIKDTNQKKQESIESKSKNYMYIGVLAVIIVIAILVIIILRKRKTPQ